jgi:hypothetical protein
VVLARDAVPAVADQATSTEAVSTKDVA